MQTYNATDWVKAISMKCAAQGDFKGILSCVDDVADLWKFTDVTNYGVNHIRYHANRMYPQHMRGTVVAVDVEGLVYAAWFARKQVSLAVDAVISQLKSCYLTTQPKHFIVAYDSERSIRRELFPEYKAKDSRPDQDKIDETKQRVIDHLTSKGTQIEMHDGYEADDVLATVAVRCQVIDQTCVLVANDVDIQQCLGPGTTIYNQRTKSWIGASMLAAEKRIKPNQVVDWLCLTGKDNAPNADGIGGKTASDMLEAYGDYYGILNHKDNLTEAKRKAVESFDYTLAKRLHKLERTLDVTWNPNIG